MTTHADKRRENRSRSGAGRISRKQHSGGPAYQLTDNRPEAAAQRELQEMADNSLQAEQAAQLKEVAHSSTALTVQRQAGLEDEEMLQGKFEPLQKKGPEEEELMQGKTETIQQLEEDEELMQGKTDPVQKKKRTTRDCQTH